MAPADGQKPLRYFLKAHLTMLGEFLEMCQESGLLKGLLMEWCRNAVIGAKVGRAQSTESGWSSDCPPKLLQFYIVIPASLQAHFTLSPCKLRGSFLLPKDH